MVHVSRGSGRIRAACRRLAAQLAREERGAVIVLTALVMVALTAMLALVIDVGYAYGQRRMAQNVADSGALAAARVVARNFQDGGGRTDADVRAAIADVASRSSGAFGTGYTASYLDAAGAVIREVGTTGSSPIPSNAVTVRLVPGKSFPTFFAPAIGVNNMSVRAATKARVFALAGLDQNHPDFAPYAVWSGNPSYLCPDGNPDIPSDYRCIPTGTKITFRSNDYKGDNVVPDDNPNWGGNSDDFKGYLHKGTGFFLEPPDGLTSGGNAIGQEPLDMLEQHLDAGKPVIMPLVSRQTGNGSNIEFTVIGFVAILLDVDNPPRTPASDPWKGTVVGASTSYGALADSTPPPTSTSQVLFTKLIG